MLIVAELRNDSVMIFLPCRITVLSEAEGSLSVIYVHYLAMMVSVINFAAYIHY